MEAAFAIIITLQIALLGWFIYHSSQCAAFHERVAALESDMKAVKTEIGDHEKGLRGNLHHLRERLSPICLWVEVQMEQRDKR